LLLDERELHLLQILCRPASTSVDVGANLGVYTEVLRCNSRRVIAIEPHPELARRLRRAFSGEVGVVNAALSDRLGRGSMRVPVARGREVDTRGSLQLSSAECETVVREVELLTLDSLELRDVGFVKIDVEGHELEVIRGSSRLIQDNRPRLLLELEERHRAGSVQQMVQSLAQFAYRGFFVWGRELKDVSEYEPRIHQAPQRAKSMTGSRKGDYVNNFAFLAVEECSTLVPRLRQHVARFGNWAKLRRVAELSSPWRGAATSEE
jgi:FkbM family methyltransferase